MSIEGCCSIRESRNFLGASDQARSGWSLLKVTCVAEFCRMKITCALIGQVGLCFFDGMSLLFLFKLDHGYIVTFTCKLAPFYFISYPLITTGGLYK